MANYNVTLVLTYPSGATVTQNVLTSDTVTVTVDTGAGNGGTWNVSGTPSNCTAGTSSGNDGTTCVVSFSSTGSYSISFTSLATDKQSLYQGTLSGTVSAGSAPTVNNSQTFATTASATTSCTIALTNNGSGTLSYNKSTTTTVPTSGWQSSATVTGLSRGTAYYLWARTSASNSLADRTDSALTVPYLLPDTSIAFADDTIVVANGATSHTVTIQNGSSNTVYQVRDDGGGTTHESRTGNGDITVTDVPSAGNTKIYDVYARRTTSSGGDNLYDDTEDSYSVTQVVAGSNSPPSITQATASSSTAGQGVSITLTGAASDSDGTISSLAWSQVSGTSVTVTNGTASGIGTSSASRNATFTTPSSQGTLTFRLTATDNDSDTTTADVSVAVTGSSGGTYGLEVWNSAGAKTLEVSDRAPRFITSGSVVAAVGNTNVSVTGMTNDDTWIVLINGPRALYSNITVTKGTNQFTINNTNSYSGSITIYYMVLRG